MWQVLLEGGGGAYTSTLKQYQAKADYFACACQQKNDGYNVPMTPGTFCNNTIAFNSLLMFCLKKKIQLNSIFWWFIC